MSFHSTAPDIASERLKTDSLPIDYVGIHGLEIPVLLENNWIPAQVDAFVSLEDPLARGIHMSRIYRSLHEIFAKEPLSFNTLKYALKDIVKRQGAAVSRQGRLKVAGKWPKNTKALKSSLSGWRYYPFFYQTEFQEEIFQYVLGGEVLYSSTCPCSASLARELVHETFKRDFPASHKESFTRETVSQWLKSEKSQSATPHAQKSQVAFKLLLSEQSKDETSFLNVVKEMESVLGTPVQTAVKREDEMEFARLNGHNMMFCEDVARRIGDLFNGEKSILDYHIRARHYESLHPFTVQSVLVKGLKGGWTA